MNWKMGEKIQVLTKNTKTSAAYVSQATILDNLLDLDQT